MASFWREGKAATVYSHASSYFHFWRCTIPKPVRPAQDTVPYAAAWTAIRIPDSADVKGNSGTVKPSWLSERTAYLFPTHLTLPKRRGHRTRAVSTVHGIWLLQKAKKEGKSYYSLYYHQKDFSRPLSNAAKIESFVLEGQEGVIEDNRITVTLPTAHL